MQDSVQPPGGGNGVAAWMLQSLSRRGRVTLLSRVPLDVVEVDQYYGTSLREWPIKNVVVRNPLLEGLSRIGLPVALARHHYLMKRAKSLVHDFHLVCSACNEQDFGVPAIDYVHYPWNVYPRPDAPEWNETPLRKTILRLYNRLCCLISGFSSRRPRNLTLANSEWTRKLYLKVYPQRPCFVLNPPALAEILEDDGGARGEGFLAIGRVSPSKEWEKLIDIVEQLRNRGHQVTLTLAGSRDDREYEERIVARAKRAGDWVDIRLDQTRDELRSLLKSHRYGLHGMVDEHFGMAVAELILGGCLTVVPDSGGQVEIVTDERLRYRSAADAVEKCDRFLRDFELREQLWQRQKAERDRFTTQHFQRSFEELLDGCLNEGVESMVSSLLR